MGRGQRGSISLPGILQEPVEKEEGRKRILWIKNYLKECSEFRTQGKRNNDTHNFGCLQSERAKAYQLLAMILHVLNENLESRNKARKDFASLR